MKTQEEMEREINERARNIMNGDLDNSYESFQKQKENQGKNLGEENHIVDVVQDGKVVGQIEKREVEEKDIIPSRSQENFQIPKKEEVEKFAAYGGFWMRFAASILTQIIITVIVGIVAGILFVLIGPDGDMKSLNSLEIKSILTIILIILIILSAYGYNIYLYFKYGQSIGYKILGLKIISEETGKIPSSGALLGRFAMKSLLTWIPYLGIIGYMVIGGMVAWSKKKQGPHDMVAKTIVVSKKNSNLGVIVVIMAVSSIPIIGILAGILFVAIDPARQVDKANESIIKSELYQIPAQSAIYYSSHGNYKNFCNTLINSDVMCSDSETEFAAIRVVKNNTYCVDANGFNGEIFTINEGQKTCE